MPGGLEQNRTEQDRTGQDKTQPHHTTCARDTVLEGCGEGEGVVCVWGGGGLDGGNWMGG